MGSFTCPPDVITSCDNVNLVVRCELLIKRKLRVMKREKGAINKQTNAQHLTVWRCHVVRCHLQEC